MPIWIPARQCEISATRHSACAPAFSSASQAHIRKKAPPPPARRRSRKDKSDESAFLIQTPGSFVRRCADGVLLSLRAPPARGGRSAANGGGRVDARGRGEGQWHHRLVQLAG